MLNSRGLYSYIQNNNLRSVGLLFGFLIAVQMMMAAVYCWIALYVQGAGEFDLFLKSVAHYIAAGFLPVIAIAEVKGILPPSDPHYHGVDPRAMNVDCGSLSS